MTSSLEHVENVIQGSKNAYNTNFLRKQNQFSLKEDENIIRTFLRFRTKTFGDHSSSYYEHELN